MLNHVNIDIINPAEMSYKKIYECIEITFLFLA